MTQDELANILIPLQNAGIDVQATASAILMAVVMGALRDLGEDAMRRIIDLIVMEARRLADAVVLEEARIKAALSSDVSRSVH